MSRGKSKPKAAPKTIERQLPPGVQTPQEVVAETNAHVDEWGKRTAAAFAPPRLSPKEHTKEGATVVDAAAPADLTRQVFLDLTAMQLFARGYPTLRVWAQAEILWASREAFLKAGSK